MDASAELERYFSAFDYKTPQLPSTIPPVLTEETLETARIWLLYNAAFVSIRPASDAQKPGDCLFQRELTLGNRAVDALRYQFKLLDQLHGIQAPEVPADAGDFIVYWTKTGTWSADNAINGVLLGVESVQFLHFQNIERYECMRNKTECQRSSNMFEGFIKARRQDAESFMLFSGSILHALGTTYTNDIDIFAFAPLDRSQLSSDVDYHLYKTDHFENNGPVTKAHENWWLNVWPKMGCAADMPEIFHNPRYHFWFLGLKFMSIDYTIKKLFSRSSAAALADLYALRNHNGFDISGACIPNMTIRNGQVVVYDERNTKKLLAKATQYIKEWHDITVSAADLSQIFKRCYADGHDIYKGVIFGTDDVRPVIRFHNWIKRNYITKYKGPRLLDVGSGYLRDLGIWDKAGIERVVAIEPSVESYKRGLERMREAGVSNVEFINGFGDTAWSEYPAVGAGAPYDLIVFSFTIHYMLDKLDVVLDNLRAVCQPGTKIMITCVDGDTFNRVQRDGRYEVRYEDDPTYGIYKVDSDNVLVYFSGVYGVSAGSFERLVHVGKLISEFEGAGFKMLERRPLSSFPNKLGKKELEISKLNTVVMLEYTGAVSGGYQRPDNVLHTAGERVIVGACESDRPIGALVCGAICALILVLLACFADFVIQTAAAAAQVVVWRGAQLHRAFHARFPWLPNPRF